MNNYKLTIQYDGTRYSGWQKQGNTADTIQGKIETVLQKWLKEDIEIHGSGRTDAGVHALCQVSNFKTSATLACPQIMAALNQYLPQDVRITSVTQVDPRFHARLNAKQKHYRYQIDNGSAAEVFERKYMTRFADTDYFYKLCRQTGHLSATFGDSSVNTDISRPSERNNVASNNTMPPQRNNVASNNTMPPQRNNVASNNTMPPQIIYDLKAMQKAAALLCGEHDFKSFCDNKRMKKSTVRTITNLTIRNENNKMILDFYGNGFLYHMVRILTGTLLEVGIGLKSPEDIPAILQAQKREAAGFTAPPQGLFLMNVTY